MKIVRMRTLAVLGFAGLSGGLLLLTSQSVQDTESKLRELKAAVAQEHLSIRMLNTEWAYLNSPERLEELSKKYLDLVPPQPNTILSGSLGLPSSSSSSPELQPAAVQEGVPVPQSINPSNALQPALLQASLPVPMPLPKPSRPAKILPKNLDSVIKKITGEDDR